MTGERGPSALRGAPARRVRTAAVRAGRTLRAVTAGVVRRRRSRTVGSGDGGARPASAAPSAPRARMRRLARRLSLAVVGLLAGASATGLTWRGLYQDAPAIAAMFRAYDLGSLAVAVPVLAGAMVRARRGSPRADALWAGMLAYVVYVYAYYVFGAAFNALFLAHVALLVLAAVALGLFLASLDLRWIAARIPERTPARAVAAVLALLAGSLGGMWTYYSLRFAVTGAAPEEGLLLQPAPIAHLGYAMDLTTLVPGYATAAVLLWRRRPMGHVLGALLLVASAVIQLNYLLALRFQAEARIPGATAFDPQEPAIAAVILAAAAALLAGLRRSPAPGAAAPTPALP